MYVDSGFDGWILKPISFQRLSEIMNGIVSNQARKDNLYKKGNWERGGWFEEGQRDMFAANTKPDEQAPMTDPSEGVKVAAASEDPSVKEEDESTQTQEQDRMLANQENERKEQGDAQDA